LAVAFPAFRAAEAAGGGKEKNEHKVLLAECKDTSITLHDFKKPEGPMVFGDTPICQPQAGWPGRNVPPLNFSTLNLCAYHPDGCR